MLPKEMIKEVIGKVCSIVIFDTSFGYTARILEVEDNWLKIKGESGITIINGDMVKEITILGEKHQKKLQ